jgi:hypothetical protein
MWAWVPWNSGVRIPVEMFTSPNFLPSAATAIQASRKLSNNNIPGADRLVLGLNTKISKVITTGDAVSSFWMSRPDVKTVLIIVPHLQALNRILDVLPALEADYRVQVVLTVPATGYHWAGVEEHLLEEGFLVLPWQQAVAARFDLAVAACHWGTADVLSPVVQMSHGPAVHDLTPEKLMCDGRVIPAKLALATDAEMTVVRESCPEAASVAVVSGDPTLDRMRASLPFVDGYREALEAQPKQHIVLAASTWSSYGLFGSDMSFFTRLVEQLPADDYRVVAVLHPFIWNGYGRRQVLSWLGEARERGLVVLPPEQGWAAAGVVADVTVGDHGSVTQYAAALGVPTLMSTRCLPDVRPGSTADLLSRIATPLHVDHMLLPQVRHALELPRDDRYAEVAARITGRPGQALAILRQQFYGLLGMPEPSHGVSVAPVPLPKPIR